MENKHSQDHLLRQLFITNKIGILLSIIWDFFLTVAVSTSARSLVFTGIGSSFSNIIIPIWLLVILFLITVVIYESFTGTISNSKFSYFVLSVSGSMYMILVILAIMNPSVAFPVVLSFVSLGIWSFVLIYFKKKISEIP